MDWKPLIWTEGIVGCGKTTFSNRVGELLNLEVIEEPVDTNFYLEPFYKDQKKYAFGMQILLLHRRYAMQVHAAIEAGATGKKNGAILDRSIAGDCVFALLHLQSGNIDELDWRCYQECYDTMCRSLLPPTLLIYLDAQPETAFQRMKARNRKAESEVPIEYLIALREGYKNLLHEAETGLTPWAHAVRVVRIPWDVDTLTDEQWMKTADTIKDACRMR